jgi:hypothetical protein
MTTATISDRTATQGAANNIGEQAASGGMQALKQMMNARHTVAQKPSQASTTVELRAGTSGGIGSQLASAGIKGMTTSYEAAWTTYPARAESTNSGVSDAERARVIAGSDVLTLSYGARDTVGVSQRGGRQQYGVNLQSRTISDSNTGRTVRLPEGALRVTQTQGDRLSVTWSGRPLDSFFNGSNTKPVNNKPSSSPLF